MQIIFEQIGILVILSLIGFIAFRLKVLNKAINEAIVKLIVRITLPLLLFTTFAHNDFSFDVLKNCIIVFAMAMLSIMLAFAISSFFARILKLPREDRALHRANTMFGNVVFLGFPLLDALFPGGEGMLYAGIFQLGHAVLMWTLGVFILNQGAKEPGKMSWKQIINPVTVGFIIGLIFMLIKIKIPDVIYKPLHGLGRSTIFISLVYIGSVLAEVKILSVLKNYRSWIVSFNKLIFIPFLLILLITLLEALGWLSISPVAAGAIILQAGMPCMILVSVLAKDLGLNDKQAVENIFLSTILSLITLPLLYYFI